MEKWYFSDLVWELEEATNSKEPNKPIKCKITSPYRVIEDTVTLEELKSYALKV